MDNIKLWVLGLTTGMKDSVCGTLSIFPLDKLQQNAAACENSLSSSSSAGGSSGSPFDLLGQRCTAARAGRRSSSSNTKTPPTEQQEPRVIGRIVYCCLLNGLIFWFSIAVFDLFVLPGLKTFMELIFGSSEGSVNTLWSWMRPMLSYTFGALWILPLFILSKVVNSLWFQDIADSAYKHTKGRPRHLPSFSKLVADTLFSILIQAFFLVQGMSMSWLPIPYLGQGISLLHMCLLYSLYAFEYKWFNMGWELHKRLSFIENNWPYFVGFGLPLALLTSLVSSYVVSGCVFAMLFPLFILSANEAEPMVGTSDCPLRLFSPVVWLSNMLFHQTLNVAVPPATPSRCKTSASAR